MTLKKSELYSSIWKSCGELLGSIDPSLAVMEQRRDKTRALKEGTMQELLTGRTRLV